MNSDDQIHAMAVSSALGGHFAAVRKDLAQVQSLLTEAVNGLLVDSLEISSACRQQRSCIEVGAAGDTEELLALSHKIEQCSKANVVHLQFQDMVHQLLDHAKARLEAMEALGSWGSGEGKTAPDASAGAEKANPVPDGHELAGVLARAEKKMYDKPVQSCAMHAGDIELF